MVPNHLEGFFYILRTGSPWRELPSKIGPWSTIYSQFRRWCLCGLWDAHWRGWRGWRSRPKAHCGMSRAATSSSISTGCKVAKRPARQKPSDSQSSGGMTTKLLAAVDETGNLCAFVLTSGNLHDQTAARQMLDAFRDIHFVGDKGFDSLSFRKALSEHGAPYRARVSSNSMISPHLSTAASTGIAMKLKISFSASNHTNASP